MAKQDTLCILGNGSHWSGLLEFEGTARIDSEFTGDIRTSGQLIVGPDARITGTLSVGELEVFGVVDGKVQAERKIVLRNNSSLKGEVVTPRLITDEGALFSGKIHMVDMNEGNRARRAFFARRAEPLPDSDQESMQAVTNS